MKYKVESTGNAIDIEVTETGEKQDKILEAFRECQQGRCSCPTGEYAKLDSLEIESDADRINLKLKSKPGTQFDHSEIGKCLAYTRDKVSNEK